MHKTNPPRKGHEVTKMDVGVIIGTVIALVVLVIGAVIVNDIIEAAAFQNTLFTVTDNIPVLMGIGGLVLAVGWAVMR